MASPQVDAENVQALLRYQFSNPHLVIEALKAAGTGSAPPNSPAVRDGNKRLAQVGNAVMRLILTDEWYTSNQERASLSNSLNSLGSRMYLWQVGQAIGLQAYIYTNTSQGNPKPSPGMIAQAVEALLGAVWYDSQRNRQAVKDVMRNLALLGQVETDPMLEQNTSQL